MLKKGRDSLTDGLSPRGSTPLYKPYRHVQPQRVGVFEPFRSENGDMSFANFALESGMVLSRELRECSNVLVVSIPDE